MTLEMIESIRKLAENHDFKGVPIPELCKMAARYAWLNKQHNFVAYIEGVTHDRRHVNLRCGIPLDEWIDNRIAEERPAAAGHIAEEKK